MPGRNGALKAWHRRLSARIGGGNSLEPNSLLVCLALVLLVCLWLSTPASLGLFVLHSFAYVDCLGGSCLYYV